MITDWGERRLCVWDLEDETEEMLEPGFNADLDPDDPMSINQMLIDYLAIASMVPMLVEDIPAIMRLLDTPEGKEREGRREWEAYWMSIDLGQRERDNRVQKEENALCEKLLTERGLWPLTDEEKDIISGRGQKQDKS